MITALRQREMKLPPKVRNLHGLVFHELEVQAFVQLGKQGAVWTCKCQCGNLVNVYAGDLKTGNTKSCGCRRRRVTREKSLTHGQAAGKNQANYTKIYKTWRSMLNRCHTASSSSYPDYGGRGITVCNEWRKSFEVFYKDMGEPPSNGSLERIDVNSGYSKANCKWILLSEQANNKRNTVHVLLNGEKMIQAEAARRLNLHPSILCNWRKKGSRIPDHVNLTFITQP
jgi:hypothetical protein